MAAPSTGPVTITIGAAWTFQVNPPPPRPPKLSVAATVVWVFLIPTRVIFGVVFLNDCPQQPNIPNFLLGLALASLLLIPFVTFSCESDAALPQQHPSASKVCLLWLITLFIITWIVAGDVWVFSIYQPNYDPTAGDGLYCNKTLYTFAFWNALWETFSFWVVLGKFFKGLMCGVIMIPAPRDGDFHRHV
ncbi:transmembrane protein 272 isoform X2 [Anabas testudineus]|uniref:transmembrane protein 272 isoform X2 n=1 Tax=Anabas testudineus TaxID=64144 RepID=UPI000E45E6F0|nr:transmembrane protein 272 isoform X2 [Anabas testudineus]